MKKFFTSVLARFLGVIALALIGVMIYSATTGGLATIPETLTGLIVTPIQSFTTSISNGVSDFFGQLVGSGNNQELIA